MIEEGSTTGIWVGKGEAALFEEFEQYFQRYGDSGGEYSRSERIKEAMEIYLVVHDTLRQDSDLPNPESLDMRELKALVRSELKFDDRV